MINVIKHTDGHREEHKIWATEWYMILCIAQMNGWTFRGHNPEVFDREVSTNLCTALERASLQIEASIYPDDSSSNSYELMPCECLLENLVKWNQIIMIAVFLGFCCGEPFRIKRDN